MDPATAFQLAGTVLTVIDFGTRLVKLSVDVYHGEDSSSKGAQLVQFAKSFQKILDNIDIKLLSQGQLQGFDHGLDRLAVDSKKFSTELLERLRKTGLLEPANKSRREAFRTALRLLFHDSEQKKLLDQLNQFRNQLSLGLLVSLRHFAAQTINDQQKVLKTLHISIKQSEKLEDNTQAILQHITARKDLDTQNLWSEDIKARLVRCLIEDDSSNQAKQATRVVLTQNMQKKNEQAFISAVSYPGMETRQQTVAKSYATTFDWALRTDTIKPTKWDSFTKWLEGDDQIYWISGKAGSGKSTLVKYLSQSEDSTSARIGYQSYSRDNTFTVQSRCYPFLRRWAGNRDLMIIPFYFWAADNGELQKSLGGLLRTLLHLMLRAQPWLIPIAFPLEWESLSLVGSFYHLPTWSEKQLMNSLLRILGALGEKDTCVCFNIDGLDEFNGEPQLAITLVEELAACGKHVKLCVASRPWVEFQEAFRSYPKLRLEDLTHDDIKLFVSMKLEKHREFANLAVRNKSFADGLVNKIVDKASGVFLWVALVVTSLLSGLSVGDKIQDLEQALDELPAGLKELYERLLISLPKKYQANRAEMIMLVEASRKELPLLVFAFADEQNLASLTSLREGSMTDEIIMVHKRTAYLRLHNRWKGLLEVASMALDDRFMEAEPQEFEDDTFESDPVHDSDSRVDQPVQYLHRTVRDFIHSADQISALKSALPVDFDAHFQLCIAYCAAMKVKIPSGMSSSPYQQQGELVSRLMYHAGLVSSRHQLDVVKIIDQISCSMFMERENLGFVGYRNQESVVRRLTEMAAQEGVLTYLEARLGDKGDPYRYSQLLGLVQGITFPQAATIRWLLEHGADPNCDGQRTWRDMMEQCMDVESLKDLDPAIRESVTAFVVYGADLRMLGPYKPPASMDAADCLGWSDSLYNELKAIPKITRLNTMLKSISSYMPVWMVSKAEPPKNIDTVVRSIGSET